MAQPLQPYGTNPAAEEMLRLSEMQRGQQGMGRTAAPVGPNLQDGGAASKAFCERTAVQQPTA